MFIAAAIGAVGGASYAGYGWLTGAQRFAIAEIEIEGSSRLSHGEVSNLLELSDSSNIFRTDMDTLESRLMASPWIAHAEVTRDLPNTLDVVIREHQAVAAIELDGLYLLNGDAEVFKRAHPQSDELEGLCIITGIARAQVISTPEEIQNLLRDTLDTLRQYQSNGARPRLGELHVDQNRGVRLVTYENAIVIHLGTPEASQLESRFRAFDSAWQALDDEEHAAARSFHIADRTPSDRVTVAFAGN